ncbi:MAG TPA: hypothetical protein DCY48_03915 [Candidatus Magasanikbacteria bacterium]|nr:MAG: hypothetical protein A3I74_01595 [Candidatus Magasanikbacteria bacterium RIFCSPLOWO2_02_FULL_47_16]OGH79851.1 MAG: hypothetical protein A3C10_00100 [Candidatus Magasanikbacteria bacterium RIFCSPHIGHO2_02_FULL_48_18]OGH82091.1 MAG: hypothetical protein A3G08_04305 [Candidatus Magasanikbacteria bacterium RIFCSPLOWO2_12_FULL_47_9b]HAZ28891.1 hypothetical protein [Candidatus Magasanikbacteria bacterium]
MSISLLWIIVNYILTFVSAVIPTPQTHDFLTFFERANQLKSVPRFSASLLKEADTVPEHSWRLALMTSLIGNEFKHKMDIQHAVAIALVHDLAESLTGDIDVYDAITKKLSREEKKESEEHAMAQITSGISFGKTIYDLWQEYEEQKTLEAKFVKALDKIEAFLHLSQCAPGAYGPKEFHANYGDKAVRAFDDAMGEHPKLFAMLESVKHTLRERFEKEGVAWVED